MQAVRGVQDVMVVTGKKERPVAGMSMRVAGHETAAASCRRCHWESTSFAAFCVVLLAAAAIATTNEPLFGLGASIRRTSYALLTLALVAAWAVIARSAMAAEVRMTALSVYSLGENDPCCNYSGANKSEGPESPRSYLRRAMSSEEGTYHSISKLVRIDVDAEERRRHAYAPPHALPHGGVLLYPTRRSSTTCVLWLPGYARCFDHYATAAIFRERASLDLVGLDLRHYGRSYVARCESGHIDQERHNIPSTIFCLTDYFEDIDDALEALSALGYTSVVLWGSSTSGLTACNYLVRREKRKKREERRHSIQPPPLTIRAVATPAKPAAVSTAIQPALIAVVLDAPLLAFRPGKLPGEEDGLIQMAIALLGKLMPRLRLMADPECGRSVHFAEQPTWLDEIALRRNPPHRYDRFLNPCRGKPVYGGYLATVIYAMAWLRRTRTRVRLPALLVLPAHNVSQPGFAQRGKGVDPHIDTTRVPTIFKRLFPAGRVLQSDQLQHESLLSDQVDVERIVDELKVLLLRTST